MYIKNAGYTQLSFKVGKKKVNLPPRGVAEINKNDLSDCHDMLEDGSIFILPETPAKKKEPSAPKGKGKSGGKSEPKKSE